MDASADLLKVNHRLESRVPEIGLLGSEGGATSSVVPTPIVTQQLLQRYTPGIFHHQHRTIPMVSKSDGSNRPLRIKLVSKRAFVFQPCKRSQFRLFQGRG